MPGWQSRSLEECIERVKYDAKIPRSDFLKAGSYPIVSQEADFINGFWDNAADLFKTDSPVIVFGDHTQVLKYIDFDFVIGADGVKVLKTKPFLNSKYFYYFLRSIRLERLGYARHYRLLAKVCVNYPSLPEQERIAAILDEAFEGIDAAVAKAEKNLTNARELFRCYIRSVFANEIEGWIEKALGQVCEMYQPKTIGTKDLVPDGPFPVFGANGIIGRYNKFNHEEPQLIITCRGATCGSVNVSYPKSWITGNAMVVRPKNGSLDLGFLEFAFRGGIDISPAITGAAQPQITRTNLSPLMVRYPKLLSEQKRLASNLEKIAEETEQLEACYGRRLEVLAELKQAVLRKAFAGELTARSVEAVQEAAE